MERRVVSLWLPRFATDRLSRRRSTAKPGSRSEALATVTAAHGGLRIAAANRRAEAAGIVPGLPLAAARAIAPELHTAGADPAADRCALAAMAEWCTRYTPWTAVDGDGGNNGGGGLWLDISGCAHLFGGEIELMSELGYRLHMIGFNCFLASADTPGTAWAVARFAIPGGAAGGREKAAPVLVPPGHGRRAIAPLPVAALRLPPATVEGLGRVGLRRIGDLLALPRAPLAARFGAHVARRLDQALGLGGEAISPRRPVPPHRARLAFAEPISRAEDIGAALARLLEELCRRLERTGHGARRLELVLYRSDATTRRAAVGTGGPVRHPARLERLFREKLDGLDSGFGVEVMVLAATAVDPLAPSQMALDSRPGADGVAGLVDRLGNRLGPDGVVRLLSHASHVPERASREVSALADVPPAAAPRPPERDGDEHSTRPRPLHLLPWPEPIRVVAPVPDHPPVMFHWRRARHRVARADGPERIGPEWWLAAAGDLASRQRPIRDYYRVEDEDGRRFWLYREGLYEPGVSPRWYLHGFFP